MKKKSLKVEHAKRLKAQQEAREIVLITVKTKGAVRKLLQDKADKFAEGNVSAWLRYAGLKYSLKKGERLIFKSL